VLESSYSSLFWHRQQVRLLFINGGKMNKKLSILSLLVIFMGNVAQALPNPSQDSRVQKIYDNFQNQLIWVKNGELSTCGKALIDTISHAGEEGLWPEDYAPIVDELTKANLSTAEGGKIADELLTLAALNYISDMKGERLNPHLADKTIYIKQVTIDETELLKNYLAVPDQCGWIQALSVPTPEYKHLKELLAQYRQKQAQGGWPQLPKGTKLAIGDKGPLVETLRAQLIAQDALPVDSQGNDVFDQALEDALKGYQSLHGLEPDGKVGGGTLTALNTPVEDRIRSIIVSLERLRWLPNPLPSRYLQVNIPGFYLKTVDSNAPVFTMPIITGRAYTKTPVFYSEMNEIIFNPSWHVPVSIMDEIAPKMARNPGAMAAKGYRWVGGSIVQSPGNANALGKIRFTIDNPFSIYLHGTPSQNLFQKADRSLSHGCIRVEDPKKLAYFVFQNPEVWSLDRITQESSGTTTKRVKLENKLPVYITYFTVFEDMDQKVHFVPDVYGQDKKVWNTLESVKRK
jgi:L,D-transpeptidase YcbB